MVAAFGGDDFSVAAAVAENVGDGLREAGAEVAKAVSHLDDRPHRILLLLTDGLAGDQVNLMGREFAYDPAWGDLYVRVDIDKPATGLGGMSFGGGGGFAAPQSSPNEEGGDPPTWPILRATAGLEDIWQVHYSAAGAKDTNPPPDFIANLEQPVHEFAMIKLVVQSDGTYTVTNTRNGFTKTYHAGMAGGKKNAR